MAGHCPEVAFGWDDSFRGKLDLNKIQGHWRNVYDADWASGHDCLSIDLSPASDTNSTKLYMKQGGLSPYDPGFVTGWPWGGLPDGRRLLYDDNGILVFNHPTDSSLSAMHDRSDPDPDHL